MQGDRPQVSRLQQALSCRCVQLLVPALPEPSAEISQVQEGQGNMKLVASPPERETLLCQLPAACRAGTVRETGLEMAFDCTEDLQV